MLAAVPGVLSVAQIGNALRVLCDDGGVAIDRVRGQLRAAGIEGEVEAGTPNLEDVFVAATGRKDAPAPERAA